MPFSQPLRFTIVVERRQLFPDLTIHTFSIIVNNETRQKILIIRVNFK